MAPISTSIMMTAYGGWSLAELTLSEPCGSKARAMTTLARERIAVRTAARVYERARDIRDLRAEGPLWSARRHGLGVMEQCLRQPVPASAESCPQFLGHRAGTPLPSAVASHACVA